jgi:isoleucyl-tRNA synthetase
VEASYKDYAFGNVYTKLFNFCTNDLSAFYFDIRKDALYCDVASSNRRRAVRTVMDEIFRRVVTWFAPILCFTMEEAWLTRFPDENGSVHLQTFQSTPEEWENEFLFLKWDGIRSIRSVVTGALELARAEKKIGSSLEAAPIVFATSRGEGVLTNVDFAEILITSGVEIRDLNEAPEDAFELPNGPIKVKFAPATGEKCARCWMVLEEVKAPTHLCNRCTDAVAALEPA